MLVAQPAQVARVAQPALVVLVAVRPAAAALVARAAQPAKAARVARVMDHPSSKVAANVTCRLARQTRRPWALFSAHSDSWRSARAVVVPDKHDPFLMMAVAGA